MWCQSVGRKQLGVEGEDKYFDGVWKIEKRDKKRVRNKLR